ncbi:type III secretion protein HrpB4 [Burkholderia sp. D7]|nr:type III secretion protein HrpB4 [Burkholderia sp. D7]
MNALPQVSLDGPLIRAAAALQAYGRNLSVAARWMHPSWITALLSIDEMQYGWWTRALGQASEPAVEGVSRALCRSAGFAAPSVEMLSQPAIRLRPEGPMPNVALLDACPADVGLQILSMRALLFRRAEVRRLIDKPTRSQLSEWGGVSIDVLSRDAHLVDAPDVARLHVRSGMPPLATLDAAALLAEGLALLERDAGGTTGPLFHMLRFALPRELNTPAWLARISPELDALGTARLFARLPELLPEWAWLFG